MKVILSPSQNFNERADGQKPSMIILHYTGTPTAEEAHERYCDPAPTDDLGRLSPHYMIDGQATIFKYVEEDKRSWHAGRASWGNMTDINSASIGIEIWNTGHEHQFEDFIPAQIDALISLIKDIRTRWDIPDHHILGHSDIAPGRKLDPGEKFPWQKLADAGIGLMPKIDATATSDMSDDVFFRMLKEYGYTYSDDRAVLLTEFRRHFLPHLLAEEGVTHADKIAISQLTYL